MATIKAFIRTSKRKKDSVNIRFRLSDGRDVQLFHVSEIEVDPNKWDATKQTIKERVLMPDDVRDRVNKDVAVRKELLLDVYRKLDGDVTRWEEEIDKRLNPENYKPIEKTFFDFYDEFILYQPEGQKRHLMVLRRILQRWEMYRQATGEESFRIDVDTLNEDDLHRLDKFLKEEHSFQDSYPKIYAKVKETRRVLERGNNARSIILDRFRTFFIWAYKTRRTDNNPFQVYKVPDEVYGTPYYITIEERDHLLNTDLSGHPETEIQRDIFVFQCLIGCRVSNLSKLKKSNLKDNGNFIEYIPRKTKDDKPVTVRVPLTQTAKDLIKKYSGKSEKLFPFISDQKYNKQIKKAFTLAGLDRLVTVLNPTTGEEEQRPLNEIASSHLARRAFVGNLYKRVKDQNLVASMSGHVEGSKAFARYRDIDDDMKQETIKWLEL